MKNFTLIQLTLLMVLSQASFSQQITKVGASEYRAFYLCDDKKVYAALWNGAVNGNTALPYNITTPVVDLAGGLYQGVAVDASGYAYSLVNSSATATKVLTDAAGNPFTGNVSCAGYFSTNFTVKSDGTVWFWAGDDYDQIAGTTSVPKPVQLKAPAGVKFKKISCGNTLLALATNGDVYEYAVGNTTPTKKALPRPASDIASGNGFQIAIVPDNIATSTDGWPYGWGYDGTYLALSGNITTPVALKSTWGITSPIRRIAACHNTTHFIDAAGQLWGMGDNAEGEVGIGTEKINHAETYATPYIWDWAANGSMTGKPVQIAKGVGFKEVFSGSSYAFYHYAIDVNNKIYSWGRNKGCTLGNGKAVNEEATYPNALDILKPTVVSPMTVQTNGYAFKLYTISAGANQTITLPTTSVTMNGSAVASTGYTIASYNWTKVSGPSSYTIQTPSNPKTVISGLTAGIYVFRLQMTDNNTATISANVTITVLGTVSQATAKAGADQTITLPVNSVNLNGSGSSVVAGGSIASYKWTKTSGPASGTITSSTSASTSVTGLSAGVYVFTLTVTDAGGRSSQDQVQVTVNAAAATTFTVSAGPDVFITLPTNSWKIAGVATVKGVGVTSCKWFQVSGPSAATLTGTGSITPTASNLKAGTYTFEVDITSTTGVVAKDQMNVNVNVAQAAAASEGMGGKSALNLGDTTTGEVVRTVKLYPNPVQANQQLAVEGQGYSAGTLKFTVYDLSGKVVKQLVVENQNSYFRQTIPVTGLVSGVYVLALQANGEKPKVFKFIIQ